MSSHPRHEPISVLESDRMGSLPDGQPDGRPQVDGQAHEVPPNASLASLPMPSSDQAGLQAEVKRDRRRQQVREAQARFRDRNQKTVEELRGRVYDLTASLEKVKADNHHLRTRLARYEHVDFPPLESDDNHSSLDGPQAASSSSNSWPGPTLSARQQRSVSDFRSPPLSGPQHVGWDKPGQSLLLEGGAPPGMRLSSPQGIAPHLGSMNSLRGIASGSASCPGPGAGPSVLRQPAQSHDSDGPLSMGGRPPELAMTYAHSDRDNKPHRADGSFVHLSPPGPYMRPYQNVGPDQRSLYEKADGNQQGSWSGPAGHPAFGFQPQQMSQQHQQSQGSGQQQHQQQQQQQQEYPHPSQQGMWRSYFPPAQAFGGQSLSHLGLQPASRPSQQVQPRKQSDGMMAGSQQSQEALQPALHSMREDRMMEPARAWQDSVANHQMLDGQPGPSNLGHGVHRHDSPQNDINILPGNSAHHRTPEGA